MKKNKWALVLVIALSLCLISAVGSSAIMHDFGKVDVVNVSTKTEVGTLTGYLFVPQNASPQNKLPAIVVSHGASASAEFVDSWFVELARRGYIVFAPNLYNHGDSSVVSSSYTGTISYDSNGLYDAVEYLSTLDLVDTEKIGITGHSLGGGSSLITTQYYTGLEQNALASGATPEEARKLNKITACLTVGYPLEVRVPGYESTSSFDGYLCDLGVILGKYDDFQAWMNKDILTNEFGPKWMYTQTGIEAKEVTEGNFYVNPENGFSFVMWNPGEIHNQNLISTQTTGYLLHFFAETLGAPAAISPANQVWPLKLLFNVLGMIGFFMLPLPCLYFLLKIPFFSGLTGKEPKRYAIPAGKDKRKFYTTTLATGAINTILLLPLILVGSFAMTGVIWPQSSTNGFALWGFFGGLVTLLFVRIGMGKKFKGNSEELGTSSTRKEWFKSLLLACLAVSAAFLVLFAVKAVFNTDFRFWGYAIRPFGPGKLAQALRYLPLFGVFQIATAIATSRNNFTTWSDKKRIAFSTATCMVPVILMLLVTYLPILFIGAPLWGQDGSNLLLLAAGNSAIKLTTFVISLAVMSFINVKAQKLTGNIWLGAFTNTMLITMITVANCDSIFPF